MSKLANPWKCDHAACGHLRANDTNHWLIVRLIPTMLSGEPRMRIYIEMWSDKLAGRKDTKHACGIDCVLKVAAQMIVDNFYPQDGSSTGKEGGHDD